MKVGLTFRKAFKLCYMQWTNLGGGERILIEIFLLSMFCECLKWVPNIVNRPALAREAVQSSLWIAGLTVLTPPPLSYGAQATRSMGGWYGAPNAACTRDPPCCVQCWVQPTCRRQQHTLRAGPRCTASSGLAHAACQATHAVGSTRQALDQPHR